MTVAELIKMLHTLDPDSEVASYIECDVADWVRDQWCPAHKPYESMFITYNDFTQKLLEVAAAAEEEILKTVFEPSVPFSKFKDCQTVAFRRHNRVLESTLPTTAPSTDGGRESDTED